MQFKNNSSAEQHPVKYWELIHIESNNSSQQNVDCLSYLAVLRTFEELDIASIGSSASLNTLLFFFCLFFFFFMQ